MASSVFARRLYPAKEQFISEENLKETESLLRNLRYSQSKAASHYEAWIEQRKKSIDAIGCLEKKLENLHRGCKTAHGVGATMEIVGGVAYIAGTILTACGHEDIGEFLTKKVSPVTGAAGMATSISSSIAETALSHKTMKDVEMILEKDKAYSKMLAGNLENFKKIDSYMRSIFNCSILSNIFPDVIRLCKEGILLLGFVEMEKSKLEKVLFELGCRALKGVNISECIETALKNVCTTMKAISNSPNLQNAIYNICNIIQQSPSAIEFVKLGLRVSIRICDVPCLNIAASLLGFSASKVTSKCLLSTVIVASNVLSVISAVKDAQEESSKYSKVLKDVKLVLLTELNNVRNNYSASLNGNRICYN